MDYDTTDIAATYDRGRDHGPEVLNLWMDAVSSYVKDREVKTILDLGSSVIHAKRRPDATAFRY